MGVFGVCPNAHGFNLYYYTLHPTPYTLSGETMPIGTQNKPLQTVMWDAGKVRLIDQTALPEKLQYVEYSDWREVAEAIRTMVVRGAPAIGCAAALGMALGSRGIIADGRESFIK